MAAETAKLVVLPNPYGTPWRTWVDTVVGYNPGLNSMDDPHLTWTEFANRLCEALPTAPRPEGHLAWEDWAASLKIAYHL